MITDLIGLEPLLDQYDPGTILVGPLLSLSLSSTFRYFYIGGNGSKVYQSIGLGFVEAEIDAERQRADVVGTLKNRFVEVITFGSHLEMARAIHTRWPNEETVRVLGSAALTAKSEPADAPPGDCGKKLVDEAAREPVDHAKCIDAGLAALMDAPPLACNRGQPTAVLSSAAMQVPMPRRPIAAPSQPLSGDRFVTQQQRRLWPNEDKDTVALAVSRLKSAAQQGNVPRLPSQPSKVANGESEAAPVSRPLVENTRSWASSVLRFCGVGIAIALVSWTIVLPSTRQAGQVLLAAIPTPLISIKHDGDSSQAAATVLPSVPNQHAKDDEIARLKAQLEISNAEIARLLGTAALSEDAARETQQTSTPPVPKEQTQQSSQVASAQAGAARVSALPVKEGRTALRLDAEEVAMFINRGMESLKSGDFVSARLLLKRAAEANNASAALMLGATFDPLFLHRVHPAVGIAPDIAQARQWYEKAAELGSDAASQELEKLAQPGQ